MNEPSIRPYKNRNVEDPSYNFRCIRTQDGRYASATAPPFPTVPRILFNSMSELLDHPGYYTWILYEGNLFFAAKALTPQEILSKHKNIHRNHKDLGIIAAGECEILPDRVVKYNFLSGTYMLPILKEFQANFRYDPFSAEYFYSQHVTPLWLIAGASRVYHVPSENQSLLPDTMTNAAINEYTQLGYAFEYDDTLENCKKRQQGGTLRVRRKRSNRKTRYGKWRM